MSDPSWNHGGTMHKQRLYTISVFLRAGVLISVLIYGVLSIMKSVWPIQN